MDNADIERSRSIVTNVAVAAFIAIAAAYITFSAWFEEIQKLNANIESIDGGIKKTQAILEGLSVELGHLER